MKKTIVLFLILGVIAVRAQELKKNEFSISLGYMFEGEVYLWESDFYGSVGETMLLHFEYVHYFSKFGVGGYYTYGSPWYDGYEETPQHEIGAVAKLRFPIGSKFQIKPGVYLGYRSYGNSAGTGFALNASASFAYVASSKVRPFIDLGIMSQPAGGNDATDITYSPTLQMSIGVSF